MAEIVWAPGTAEVCTTSGSPKRSKAKDYSIQASLLSLDSTLWLLWTCLWADCHTFQPMMPGLSCRAVYLRNGPSSQ